LVRDGVRSLEYVESCNFGCAKTDGYIYPSYYEKNADNITFSVADWVRRVVPAERLPGPDRQPMFTVHDIPDWDTWLNPAEWDPVENACEARWRVWKARVQGSGFGVQEGEWESARVTEWESARVTEYESASVTGSTNVPSHSPTLTPSHAQTLAPPTAAPPRQSSRFEAILNSPRSKRMRPRQRRRLEALAARLRAAREASG
jgi:hypothetical protein